MTNTCLNCRHALLVTITANIERRECRRHPPSGRPTTFPEVAADWFCGDHAAIQPAPSILMPGPIPKLSTPTSPALTTRKGGKR